MSQGYDAYQPEQGMSSGTKFLLGCGAAGFLAIAVVCGGLIFLGNKFLDFGREVVGEFMEQVDEFAGRFEDQGYHRVRGQVLEVTTEVRSPTVYTVQAFTLKADTQSDIAVIAQVAEIEGTVNGDLHFLGQVLTIHPDAVVTGNVYVEMAQVVEIDGTVEGEVIRSAKPVEEEAAAPSDEPAAQLADPDVTEERPADESAPDVKPPPGDVIDPKPANDDAR